MPSTQMNPLHVIENKSFIGRNFEKERLEEVASGGEAAIIVVHGRRRVGKTELLEQTFRNRNILKFEGLEGKNVQQQRDHVVFQLARYAQDPILANLQLRTWVEVFDLIARYVKSGVWTIYFEEVQWLANYQSEFISELKYSWDNAFRYNPKLILILCGSSPSFMINKVMHSKALYNRSMHEIALRELSLIETAKFLPRQAHKEVMDAYLVLGGIPEYIKRLKKSSSIFLSLCEEAFTPGGFFLDEYKRLFVSSLASNPFYQKVIDYLSRKKRATRNEIIKALDAKSGGTLSDILIDLELCGFIEKYYPYDKDPSTNLIRYCIRDAYLTFYYKFIHPAKSHIKNGDYVSDPTRAIKQETYRRWLGYAFERFCRRNSRLVANKLRFSGVKYHCGSYFTKGTQISGDGSQIDLIFDRADHVLTICEIRYTESPVDTIVIEEFEKKLSLLPNRNKKTIHKVLISNKGASEALIRRHYFDELITLEDFFDERNL